MAKRTKIRNFKLEQDELKPMTIGIFESRRRSNIGIFVIMTLFVLAIVFMPQLSDYINDYLELKNGNKVPNHKVEEPIVPPDDVGSSHEENFYLLTDNPKVLKDGILFDGFIVNSESNILSFKVTNQTNNTVQIGSLNYYIELYNEDQTLLERIKVTGKVNITSGAYEEYSKDLSSGIAGQIQSFTLVKKDVIDYPPKALTPDEEGNAVLVCSRPNEEVTYKFNNNLLKEVSSEYSYKKTAEMLDEEFANYYKEYQEQASGYNAKAGISSVFFLYNDGFNVTTTVNLAEAERTFIFKADTFSLDTEVKVVNFEMDAQGFDCK